MTGEELAAADEKTRGAEIRGILAALLPHLAQSPDVPVLVGGDFNTDSRSNTRNVFGSWFDTDGPYPEDNDGVEGTIASRSKPAKGRKSKR